MPLWREFTALVEDASARELEINRRNETVQQLNKRCLGWIDGDHHLHDAPYKLRRDLFYETCLMNLFKKICLMRLTKRDFLN